MVEQNGDSTFYFLDGKPVQVESGGGPAEALTFLSCEPYGLAVLVYPYPTEASINGLAAAWNLHPVLIEDLSNAQQRPKAEWYRNVFFLSVRAARYLEESESVEFTEIHVVSRPGAVAILCPDRRWINGESFGSSDADSDDAFLFDPDGLLGDPHLLQLGNIAVIYRLLDKVVDGYQPVLDDLEKDLEQIEDQVFAEDIGATERIYRLSQQVVDIQHATAAALRALNALSAHYGNDSDTEMGAYLQDLVDHLTRITVHTQTMRDSLSQILQVDATLVAQRQNEDMKKISGWAAILFAPTLIAAIYGMNFELMPELVWRHGYPLAVFTMVLFSAALYFIFKRNKWM